MNSKDKETAIRELSMLTKWGCDEETGYCYGDMDPPTYAVMKKDTDGGYLDIDDVLALIESL